MDYEELYYRLGRGSVKEAKEALEKLDGELGPLLVYLDGDSETRLLPAYRILLVESNIEYLRRRSGKVGSVKLDFMRAYIASKRKLVVSDREVEEAGREEI